MTELSALAVSIRRDILEATWRAGKNGSHVGGALSCADILAVLYGAVMRFDGKNPQDPERDRFFLSKGHSAVALYAALHQRGALSDEEFQSFEADGGKFPGHCVLHPENGVELSSGSLGLGLSFGLGSALAAKKQGKDYRAYVLMGNGECDEGSVWEAATAAAHFGADNLLAIVDHNALQLDGDSQRVMDTRDLAARFRACGFTAWDVDGHDIPALLAAFAAAKAAGTPAALIAHTVKGKGVSFMEGQPQWHHASLNEEQYKTAMAELGVHV